MVYTIATGPSGSYRDENEVVARRFCLVEEKSDFYNSELNMKPGLVVVNKRNNSQLGPKR